MLHTLFFFSRTDTLKLLLNGFVVFCSFLSVVADVVIIEKKLFTLLPVQQQLASD